MTKLIVIAVVALQVQSAEATCVKIEAGCSVCCSGPERCSTSCPKRIVDWRPGSVGRLELVAGGVAATSDDSAVGAGARISVAYHQLYKHREWVFGNELGVELRGERTWIDGAEETQLSVKPILRVARASRFRTASVFGAVLPEIGASLRDGPAQVFFRWSPFTVDVRITSWLAISVEPIAAAVGIGGGTRTWWSAAIGARFVRSRR